MFLKIITNFDNGFKKKVDTIFSVFYKFFSKKPYKNVFENYYKFS